MVEVLELSKNPHDHLADNSPEEEVTEGRYRRGYQQGYHQAIIDIELTETNNRSTNGTDLQEFETEQLYDWRFNTNLLKITPPPLYIKQKNVEGFE